MYNLCMYICQECNKKINTIYKKNFKRHGVIDYVKWVCEICLEKPKPKRWDSEK